MPLGAQLDVTYRCNERCVHCYLDHDDHGEMTTAEITNVLDQLAAAGTFFLTLSGGEVLMRWISSKSSNMRASYPFASRLRTNAFMIREKEADPHAGYGHQLGAGQHLLSSAGSARRHHAAAGSLEAFDQGDSVAARARA